MIYYKILQVTRQCGSVEGQLIGIRFFAGDHEDETVRHTEHFLQNVYLGLSADAVFCRSTGVLRSHACKREDV